MRKDWKSIPLPQLMQDHCKIDPRGLPVPFVVLEDQHGQHHFKVNDVYKTIRCMRDGLCTICGQEIDKDNMWLVGGIASAFDEKGYYVDHPIHKQCGEYALQVCPYLCYTSYNAKVDIEKIKSKVAGNYDFHNPTVDQDKLPLFVFIRPLRIEYHLTTDIFVKAIGPYHEVEFWNEGQRITDIKEVEAKLTGTKWEKYLNNIYEYLPKE